MLKRSRFFISATLIAVIFASTFILSNPLPARACPPPPPDTLLALYLKSDLIVAAEITSEKEGEIEKDYKDYYTLTVYRSLKVSSTLKGKAPADLVFTKNEFRNRTPPEPDAADEDEAQYYPYGYKGYSSLRPGNSYLFFFTKDADSGEYEISDRISGVKKLSDYELDVHKKRLKELQSIIKTPKNQLQALTQWLIRCVAEPATRWDGIFDLISSFEAFEYNNEEDAEETFRIDEDFNAYTPAIAKSLTDSQKEYLSDIAFGLLRQNASSSANGGFYYSLSALVRRWDKTRLAMYAFGLLQATDSRDFEKTKTALSDVAEIVGDDQLSELADRFPTAEAAANEAEKSDETEVIDRPAATPENAPQNTEQTTENTVETIATNERAQPQKLTAAEIREKVLQDFVGRYQYLLANNFPEEPETSEQ